MELSTSNLEALNQANDPSLANMVSSVLVIGAGELGLCVLDALAHHPKRREDNVRLAVLLRQATLDTAAPEKKNKIQQLSGWAVHFESADVEQAPVEELAAIMGKYHTVVSCTGMELPSGTQIKLAQAATQSNVKRYFPWQFGMDYDLIGQGSSQDLFDEQLRVREILRSQDSVEWVIVSTGLFMSFLLVAAFGVVDLDQRVVRGLGSWDNTITVTTPRDIGRITADIVLDPRGIKNQVVYAAGDTVSYAQIADLVDERAALGSSSQEESRFTRELWTLDILKEQMDKDATVMVKYRDTFAQGVGVAWDMDKTENAARGMPMTDLKAYLETVQM